VSYAEKNRDRYGFGRILTINNAKTIKGEGLGYVTGLIHLAPHTTAGVGNVCEMSTPECREL